MKMTCTIEAPVNLTKDVMTQTWAVSSTQDGYSAQTQSEVFSCTWDPNNKRHPWSCLFGYVKTPLVRWHNGSLDKKSPKIYTLINSKQRKTQSIKGKKMDIVIKRHFSRPKKLVGKLSEWKLGEVRPFFVSFKHGKGENEKKGASALFNLYLFEGDISSVLKPVVAALPH